MDTNDVGETCKESTSVEEKSQPIEQNLPEVGTYQFTEESKEKKKSNISDVLIDKTSAISKEASTMKKEVEILKIELIVPQRGYIDIDNKNVSNEIVAVGSEAKLSTSNLNTETVEVIADGQSDMNTVLETVQMQEIDRSVGGMQQEEKLNLHINPEQHMKASEPVGVNITSGLSLLAQYLSDDDADSVVEVPIRSTQDYRDQVVEIDSSSESDDSTDSSGVEYLNELSKTIKKRLEADVDEDDEVESEDRTGKKKNPAKLRVKGELLLEELPPIEDLKITVPEDECVEFGKIHSIVDQLVLVSALPSSSLMDLDTVLFLERGQKVLGEVFDVLGQVADPLYCVRFNSNKQIKEKNININDKVYVAPKTKYTQYVILSNLMTVRGSDASWENDIEPPPRFLDYSDDEQEQLARRQLRNKDRPADHDDVVKRVRTLDEDNSTTNMARRSHSQIYRYPEQRNNRGGSIRPSNANNRPRCEIPYQYQRGRTNNHRNSWHSNYYPKPFVSNTEGGYGMHSMQNIPHSPGYRPHVPAYIVPPVHNYPYPPLPPTPYGPPPMFRPHAPQITSMSNAVAPPPHETPHILPRQEQSTTPPPPPGSQ